MSLHVILIIFINSANRGMCFHLFTTRRVRRKRNWTGWKHRYQKWKAALLKQVLADAWDIVNWIDLSLPMFHINCVVEVNSQKLHLITFLALLWSRFIMSLKTFVSNDDNACKILSGTCPTCNVSYCYCKCLVQYFETLLQIFSKLARILIQYNIMSIQMLLKFRDIILFS